MKQRDNWHKLTEREQTEYQRIVQKLEAEDVSDEQAVIQRETLKRVRGPVRLSSPFEGLSL